MNRLRALVDVAGGMVDAMSAAPRLAGVLAGHLKPIFPAGVSVWLRPAAGGVLLVEVAGHGAGTLERFTGLVRADPSLAAGQIAVLADDGDVTVLVPMYTPGRLVGAVAATVAAGAPMVDDEVLEFVRTLADLAAVTLHNSRVLADATAVTEDLRARIAVFDDISDALIALDPDGRIVNWNAGAERIYGYSRADALGCDLFALLATQFFTGDGQPLARADVVGVAVEAGSWRGEVRERRADGVPLTVLCSLNVSSEGAGQRVFALVNRDITEQRREEHRALHDAVTGLPNHRMLTNRLYDGFARACRNGTSLAVLMVDLSDFDAIRDGHGREVADAVLRSSAGRLAAALRGTDTVARIQGDGFVVVLEKAGTEDNVQLVADRITRAFAEPVEVAGNSLTVHPVIGAALLTGTDGPHTGPDRLIEVADSARHLARAAGVDYALEHLSPIEA